ncbi:hypothetical protein LCGC14_0209790 [marine sediment metagenome]|uniref:Uncharacterized protein n=1 Tax=marine sediment metagenome TaxID=412755 RepID=A0A0F9X054_9ZZZZ|nr:DUF4145 domain-containing protein [Halomonas sp.]HDZ48223.1 DUF4145 domain-containing protein [Halomonas sp.]HEB03489.1 DUF4145 domain-containing protein [Halomonas sp.]
MVDENLSVVLSKIKVLNDELRANNPPPEDTGHSAEQPIIYMSLVQGTRGYIEKLSHQINGTYENGWYDACAVMIRRLVETLIIECFESKGIAHKIQNTTGDFVYLSDLISATLSESSWNIGRNAKKSLKALKDIGDKSAHSRRFIAQRRDIDKVMADIRNVVQELIYLASLK